MYKGYVGYKTSNRLAENRRISKGIIAQSKVMSKPPIKNTDANK